MVSNGIEPNRDPASKALVLGPLLPLDWPGGFNELVQDVSVRANTLIGTRDECLAYAADPQKPKWLGLCWIEIPTRTAAWTTQARTLYWTGTVFDDPTRRAWVQYNSRAAVTSIDNPVAQNSRSGLVGGTWFNAPPGAYAIDATMILKGNGESAMTIFGSVGVNNSHATPDYETTIDTKTRDYHWSGQIYDHSGGNLNVDIGVIIAGTSATVYRNGSGCRFSYLGRAVN